MLKNKQKLLMALCFGLTLMISGNGESLCSAQILFEKKPINPACVEKACCSLESALTTPIDLKTDACQKAKDTTGKQDGSYFSYKDLGEVSLENFTGGPSFHVIYSSSSGGGTGQFTQITLMKVDDQSIQWIDNIDGGDRCNGGISDAELKDGFLIYKKSLTPHALFSLTEENQTINLPDCANCCVGQGVYKGGVFLQIAFDKASLGLLQKSCFTSFLTQETFDKGKDSMTLDELKIFNQQVKEKCFKES